MQKGNGFTLVELAISLMIIGLLIAGVLKGKELVDNARATQLVRQVKAYETAIISFEAIYNALSGDIRNPGTRIPGCTASPCNVPGNGDKRIGATIYGGNSVAASNTEERHTFWIHLAAANLISGIDVNGYGSGTPEFGKDYPSTPFGAGFQAVHFVWSGGLSDGLLWRSFNGNFLKISPNASATTTNNVGTTTARQAAFIDRKMDDGMPNQGIVFSWNCSNETGTDSNGYRETTTTAKNTELGFDIF